MKRVSIVGGGVLGTVLAARLGEAGFEATLYERGALGEGATAASMAVFTWQSLHPTGRGSGAGGLSGGLWPERTESDPRPSDRRYPRNLPRNGAGLRGPRGTLTDALR
ncbi:hypothetical protein BRC86_05940 [Halobacteriales archaeon QS_3_64_16]|nr:MAG: hypothetical protein BRC86_05940 [Halobacteriales archaeon QS_3_64_16]